MAFFSFFTIILGTSLGVSICYYDWRDQEIPLLLLGGFFLFSLGNVLMNPHPFPLFTLFFMGTLLLTITGIEHYKNRCFLGSGDKILLISCAFWLPLETLPFFFILAGTLGCLTGLYWQRNHQNQTFPFAPAILCSLALMLLCNS